MTSQHLRVVILLMTGRAEVLLAQQVSLIMCCQTTSGHVLCSSSVRTVTKSRCF